MKQQLELKVNGEIHELYVHPWKTLVEVLREELALTGTKTGCETGHCGACTVLIDGIAVKSCMVLIGQTKGREVLTIEGVAGKDGLHSLQKAFIENYAFQCGYCTPGMILSAKALLDENPNPTEDNIRVALNGNLCRCGMHKQIVEAVLSVGDNNSE